jgi:hypothetical protein
MQPLRPSECGGPFRQLLRWIGGRVPQGVHDPRSALSLPKIPRRTQAAWAGEQRVHGPPIRLVPAENASPHPGGLGRGAEGTRTPDPPCLCRECLAALRRPGPGSRGYTTQDPPCLLPKMPAALRRPGPGSRGYTTLDPPCLLPKMPAALRRPGPGIGVAVVFLVVPRGPIG